MKLVEFSIGAGIEAALAVMDIYSKDFGVYIKEDKSPVTDADLESTKILESRLGKTGLPIISEENEIPDYSERRNYERYFLLDPIDGTKEFVNKTGEFCINIALVEKNIPTLGCIVNPSEGSLLIGGDLTGTIQEIRFDSTGSILSHDFLGAKSLQERIDEDVIRLTCSRRANESRLLDGAKDLFPNKNYEIKKKGSALKFIDLALNKADYYLRFGNTMEWDIAPGFAILNFLGGSIDDLDTNEPMRFNKEILLNSPFLAYNRKLHE